MMPENQTLNTAHRAFAAFAHGMATGEWQSFLEMLTDDVTIWFPMGKYHGLNEGKERAAEFFHYVSHTLNTRLEITIDRVTSNDTTVMFECRDHGTLANQPYKNRVVLSLDVRGDQICAYREYFGSDGKSN